MRAIVRPSGLAYARLGADGRDLPVDGLGVSLVSAPGRGGAKSLDLLGEPGAHLASCFQRTPDDAFGFAASIGIPGSGLA